MSWPPFVPPAARAVQCHELLPRGREHDLDAAARQNPNLPANYSEAEPEIHPLTATTTLPFSCPEILTAFKVMCTLNIHSYTTFVSPSSPYPATETPGRHRVATRVYNSHYSSPKNHDFCEPLNYAALMKNTGCAHEAGSYPSLTAVRLTAIAVSFTCYV